MMPSDMPALPGTTCDRFDAEVRRFIATAAVSRPVEIESPVVTVEPERGPEPETTWVAEVRRPWHTEAA